MNETDFSPGGVKVNTQPALDRSLDDSGNIVHFEHVNLKQPDQQLATIFYISGLGLTRDPYMKTGVENMWVNVGRNQFHLPTGAPQRLRGVIGLIVPDLDALRQRLARVAPLLVETAFRFEDGEDCVSVTCPWGNRFRCHAPSAELGNIELGLCYVEFAVPAGTAEGIVQFYKGIMGAEAALGIRDESPAASIRAGRDQVICFRETHDPIPPYDGHHIQIYIADFSGPYRKLSERSRITRETDSHEWRFRDIVHPKTNEVLFTVEHEVRSLKHPLFGRPLVNRNPAQNNRSYLRGQDSFSGIY
jgi:hypothetical protein